MKKGLRESSSIMRQAAPVMPRHPHLDYFLSAACCSSFDLKVFRSSSIISFAYKFLRDGPDTPCIRTVGGEQKLFPLPMSTGFRSRLAAILQVMRSISGFTERRIDGEELAIRLFLDPDFLQALSDLSELPVAA